MEELVLLPNVHVRSWKLSDVMTAHDIRQSLLSIRLLSITKIVLMVDRTLSNRVVEQVSRPKPINLGNSFVREL